MNTDEFDATAELDTTAVLRMIREDLESSGVRNALTENGQASGHERAEAVYRSVAPLRDLLPPDAQKQLAICFEWAREGIAHHTAGEVSPELSALHAAYGYARDVMLETTKNSGA
ncbi:MAG TPA: hypothetical protein VIH25_02000 [Steroidobacteraceae bacterium]